MIAGTQAAGDSSSVFGAGQGVAVVLKLRRKQLLHNGESAAYKTFGAEPFGLPPH
jgi:hypothetical protein